MCQRVLCEMSSSREREKREVLEMFFYAIKFQSEVLFSETSIDFASFTFRVMLQIERFIEFTAVFIEKFHRESNFVVKEKTQNVNLC